MTATVPRRKSCEPICVWIIAPGWAKGGDSGPALIPGDPLKSLLIQAVSYTNDDLRMPPKSKLSQEEINTLVEWVKRGAPDPREALSGQDRRGTDEFESRRQHWAYQAMRHPQPPKVADSTWSENPIDRFISARLQAEKLKPSPMADRHTLIRRVSFDLIGLPPTPDEIEAFVNDNRPDAWERVVDRLLASPYYGERWGRHWLDLVRYADTNGADENKTYAHAWRYRDYVVRSFNADKPFDQFAHEQLAGDLLPETQDESLRNDRLIATGFWLLGPKMLAEQDKDKLQIDVVDEQMDVLSKTFLAQTLTCARCHDHKFDPFSAKDYYALAGILRSTKSFAHLNHVSLWNERAVETDESRALQKQHDEKMQRLAELEKRIEAVKKEFGELEDKKGDQAKALDQERRDLEPEIKKLKALKFEGAVAMAVAENKPVDLPVHVRGSHLNLAKTAEPRGTPKVFGQILSEATIDPTQSGRLALAQWLTEPEHPLTARVMVNRIWQGHFGFGLVRTPSNFGLRGEQPTHPDLLDWLARTLINDGWSIKKMHRHMLLSQAYRMASDHDSASAEIDPENRLWWRQNRRRLEAEPIRDALLAVSGNLDRTMGGSLLTSANDAYSREGDHYQMSKRRALYLPIVRVNGYDMFSIFDYTENAVHAGQRATTTVSHQALFMMNSPLVTQEAKALAQAILGSGGDASERVRAVYLRLFARPADDSEVKRVVAYVAQLTQAGDGGATAELEAWADFCQTLMATNEFVYIR